MFVLQQDYVNCRERSELHFQRVVFLCIGDVQYVMRGNERVQRVDAQLLLLLCNVLVFYIQVVAVNYTDIRLVINFYCNGY